MSRLLRSLELVLLLVWLLCFLPPLLLLPIVILALVLLTMAMMKIAVMAFVACQLIFGLTPIMPLVVGLLGPTLAAIIASAGPITHAMPCRLIPFVFLPLVEATIIRAIVGRHGCKATREWLCRNTCSLRFRVSFNRCGQIPLA